MPSRFALATRIIAVALFAALGFGRAFAHPLGNYTINQYFLVDLRGDKVELYYLLDMAEIPSFTELDLLDTDFDGEVTDEETTKYLDAKVPPLFDLLSFKLNGESTGLRITDRKLTLLEGMGGMVVFNLFIKLEPEQWAWASTYPFVVEVESTNYPKEPGVRECMFLLDKRFGDDTHSLGVNALGYQTLVFIDEFENPIYQDLDAQFLCQLASGLNVPQTESKRELSFGWTFTARAATDSGEQSIANGMAGPITIVNAPEGTPDLTRPTLVAAEGPLPVQPLPVDTSGPTPQDLRDRFTKPTTGAEGATGKMIDRLGEIVTAEELTPWMIAIAFVVSIALGMGHAFSPGHGKTVMAAYLIGERGTLHHAMLLGVVVTITHVWSVIALGVVVLYLQESISAEQLTFWTGLASGVIIVIIGALLFVTRFKAFVLARAGVTPHDDHPHHDHGHHDHVHVDAHDHDHGHIQEHEHGHAHGHDHDHGHTHGPRHHHAHNHEPGHTHDHDHHHSHGVFSHSHVVETKDGAPPTYKSILWLGISGGIVPCPAALVVLMLAINIGRLAFGLLLILTFSLGLAAVLVAIGVAVVRASGEIRKHIGARSPLLLALPLASSVLITILGLWMLLYTLIQHRVVVFPTLG